MIKKSFIFIWVPTVSSLMKPFCLLPWLNARNEYLFYPYLKMFQEVGPVQYRNLPIFIKYCRMYCFEGPYSIGYCQWGGQDSSVVGVKEHRTNPHAQEHHTQGYGYRRCVVTWKDESSFCHHFGLSMEKKTLRVSGIPSYIPSLIFLFHPLPFPVHSTAFSFWFFTGFFAIFIWSLNYSNR